MIKFEVTFDLSTIERALDERFGEGSAAQYEWSRIVFNGSREYMPHLTGMLEDLSYMHSEPLFDKGELKYSAVAEGTDYAHYLWQGILYVDPVTGSAWARAGVTKVPTGKELNYSQMDGHPNAGARWVERAAADLYSTWVQDMQNLIDSGVV